jgi:uncharacterized membrane protein YfcA
VTPELWLLVVGAAVAGFVQGLSGFAFGMVAMSFWVWGIEPRVASVMAVFGSLTGQLVAVFSAQRPLADGVAGTVTRDMWPLLPLVAVALLVPSLLGARLYVGLSEAAFRKLVLSLLSLSGLAMLVAAVPRLLAP